MYVYIIRYVNRANALGEAGRVTLALPVDVVVGSVSALARIRRIAI